jgi:hypothetical protein
MAGVAAVFEAAFEGVLVRVDVPPPIAANKFRRVTQAIIVSVTGWPKLPS